MKPKRLSDSLKVRHDERFTFFYCLDILRAEDARQLRSEFPIQQLESLRRPEDSHSTISSYRHPNIMQEILSESANWKDVHDWFTSSEFVSDALRTFANPLLKRYPPIVRTLLKQWILRESRYFGEIQFSIRYTGSVLSPHTDNADKALALIVYLPSEIQTEAQGGTGFYLPRRGRLSELMVFKRYVRFGSIIPFGLRRLRSTKLPTSDALTAINDVSEHLKFFDTHYQLAMDPPFRLGSAGGFIKNQYSWHDLRLHTFAPGQVRCSLLVNIMLRPSKFRAVLNRILVARHSR